ncbi:glycosyltransferase family 2 protein [Metabacillus arenae]|uniref:Glycosyltransferase family 2 protein n=1 Tax=Metabacillus arenae TaxID=2771434 RepID=A0A926RXV9_9BACI|nr:glycosyltransferase family 2 protein [Metabacillus arenae]MBD1381376.1 glycosyltransferase family 2 protein [Metabacillus arenae]
MQSNKLKISVVIPIYNVELYLEECLDSVINQTYGIENLEVILIEDQSTDNSYEIAANYQKMFPEHVTLIKNEENMGLGKNRNIGVEHSTGDYVLFIDSDDKFPLDAIEKFTNPLKEDPDLELLIGTHRNWFGEKLTSSPIYKQLKLFANQSIINITELQLKELLLIFDLTPAWAKLYKTEWIKKNQYKAVEGHYYEDAFFTMTTFFNAKKIKFIKDVVYLYRRDNFSSITRTFSKQKNDDYLKSIMDVRTQLLIGDFDKYKMYSELRLFNMWRNVIFVNCVELISNDELPDYEEDIKRWLLLSKELSSSFVGRLPLFWQTILKKISTSKEENLIDLIYYFKRLKKANPKYISRSVFNENERTFSFAELLTIFNTIENNLHLFEHKISNVYFWRLVRFTVFENILVQLKMQKLMGSENTFGKSSILEQIERYHTTENSPFYGEYSLNSIILDHSRRQKYKGKYIDYKSYHLLEQLDDKNIDYQVLELPHNGEHYIDSSENRKYLESLFLFLEKKTKSNFSFNQDESQLLLQIEEAFYEQTGVILEIRDLIKKVINDFKLRYLYFVKLFKKRGVKKVYLVGGWWHTAIIAAAHKLNIEVIDVQYAAYSKYHLGFCYDNVNSKIPYYPDKIYVWGEYWKNNGYLPIKEENKLIFGNKFMQEKIEEYKDVKKKQQILVISQGVHGDDINHTAYKLAEKLPNYEIVVKLHPKENEERYKDKYNGLPNFKYADNSIDLFHYFAESTYTIGVFSTAIFEAAAFHNKVILLNLLGVEHFIDLVESENFYLVNDEREIVDIVCNENNSTKSLNTDMFFSTEIGIKNF